MRWLMTFGSEPSLDSKSFIAIDWFGDAFFTYFLDGG
jgi:hypothetical protein